MQRFGTLGKTGKFSTDQFDIASLDDEIRVDHLCESLLRLYYRFQVEESGARPEVAGANARGADYLLREFIIGDRRENLFRIDPKRIRQFAGNWYIAKSLEPNRGELQTILQGTAGLYAFLSGFGLYPAVQTAEIEQYCRDLDYYQRRIDDFWAIENDGFDAWCAACPVEP